MVVVRIVDIETTFTRSDMYGDGIITKDLALGEKTFQYIEIRIDQHVRVMSQERNQGNFPVLIHRVEDAVGVFPVDLEIDSDT